MLKSVLARRPRSPRRTPRTARGLLVGLTALGLGGVLALPTTPARANARTARHYTAHVVKKGESLSRIARTYGCSIKTIQETNGLSGEKIRRGEALAIPPCGPGGTLETPTPRASKSGAAPLRHRVRKGENLSRIARTYGCSVADLRAKNGIEGSVIMPGQELLIPRSSAVKAPEILGQSVGAPQRGRLVNASRLRSGKGYLLRRPERTYGTSQLVHYVREVVGSTRKQHPAAHRLAIGDLSSRRGGPLSGHRSHQSGRDIDIGLFYTKRPSGYPSEFKPGTASNLDMAATWTLIKEFAATAKHDGGVEVIFLDYELQRALYKWARKQGVPRTTLRKILQYPAGRWADAGVVQHYPNHADHLHVRFKCPKGDKGCS